MTDNFKRFMTFSRGERIAIITIVSMIVIALIIKYLLINNPPKKDYFKHDLDSIIARREAVLDSVRKADSVEKAKVKTIEKPTKKDKPHHNEIPRYARNDKPSHHVPIVEMTVVDLNTADTTQLKQLPGIGSAFAKRIVEYRIKLGGYCEAEQLLEVYRMDSSRYDEIKNHVEIGLSFIPNQLKINNDEFKTLLKHPYLEYDDVKKIVNYREQKGLITSWEQLTNVVGDAINPKLQYYIDYQ